jgi:WD40 repeat protein
MMAVFDGTTRLWDSVTGECLKVFSDHKRPVYAHAFSPNGEGLATGSGDGCLHVYSMAVSVLIHFYKFLLMFIFQTKEKVWSW